MDKKPARNYLISSIVRQGHQRIILNQIRRFGPISRTAISSNTKISKPTITRIVDSLIIRGLVLETGTEELEGAGRRPVKVELNLEAFFSVGVFVSPDSVRASVVTASMDILSTIEEKIEDTSGAKVLEILVKTINKAIDDSQVEKSKIVGVGIGVPGVVEFHTGENINDDILSFINGIKIKSYLENALGLTVIIDSNANVQTLKEYWSGYAGKSMDFINVVCSEMVSCGVILNGNLVRGWKNITSGLGHMIVNMNGRYCSCGRQGCVDAYSSEHSIKKILKEELNKGRKSNIQNYSDIELNLICECAAKGDDLCSEILDSAADVLAVGISNLIGVFNPEMVILSGTVFEKCLGMYSKVVQKTWKKIFSSHACDVIFQKRDTDENTYINYTATIAFNSYFDNVM